MDLFFEADDNPTHQKAIGVKLLSGYLSEDTVLSGGGGGEILEVTSRDVDDHSHGV